MSTTPTASNTLKLLRGGWHPLRLKCLTVLSDREASPTILAPLVGEPIVKNVSYHVRKLEDLGLVEEVRTETKRGAVEHFFKAVERPIMTTEQWAQLSPAQRREASLYAICIINGDFGQAVEADTLDESLHRHLSRTPLCLDEEAFRTVNEELEATFYRLLEIQAESDQRRAESGDPGRSVRAVMASFLMP